MDPKVIQFGDEGQRATRDMARHLDTLLEQNPHLGAAELRGHFRTLESIDRQYGGEAPLPLEDVDEVVSACLAALAYLDRDAERAGLEPARTDIADLTIATALWAIRHGVGIAVPEPVANALALKSNRAPGKAELSGVLGLMLGVIAHTRNRLAADLERSNPERAWRILHVNAAITAIRTEDPALMDAAFDALDAALPDERAGFYAEALALALSPRIPAAVRERIEARHSRWQ